jgi:carbamoylphosphate synthase large subunit
MTAFITSPVLVTGAAGPAGTSLVRELAEHDVRVHAADSRPRLDAVPPVVSWHVLPSGAESAYLPALRRLLRRLRAGTLIPTTDGELPVLATVRHALGPHVHVMVPGPAAVAMAQDKLALAWQLAAREVPTPRCASPSDFPDTGAALRAFRGSLVLRPRRSGGGRGGARLVRDAGDVDWTRLGDDLVVQDLVPGREYDLVLYRPDGGSDGARSMVAFERLGRVPGEIDARRLRPGSADEVERTAWAAVRALGVTGPAEVVVRRAADDRLLVLSVRPRFGRHCVELLQAMLAPPALPRQRAGGSSPKPVPAATTPIVRGDRHR